ncbi:zinc finger ZZ-type and EF-hand domain-containing protein 1 [Brienomyrus brachyistius]|uniref:zinc finger ZZ-type and EF-hand domain-containing protein 1 n=1 Tax=Brienomyrus brachyistius TaxID=42636 RepID=UPI0020B2E466|nr:zinc finger ZZ-type and EF-hand domain-containing protein 1 [Brienomyrus brachyistius]
MGNVESGCGGGASGDEEDVETDSHVFAGDSPASATTGGGAAAVSGASGSGGVRVSNSSPAPAFGLPAPEDLLEQGKLRSAAARMSDSWVAVSESVLARNESALVRWLEERLGRGEETVTLEQFCEMLESRDAPRHECEEAFGQFDAEGDGIVDVENMLMVLKSCNGANLQGELSHVIRQLQACSLTPGFIDIFSKTKDRLGSHASKILKFLHRNRIPSSAIPFPVLEGYSSLCTMRSSVVQSYLDFLLQKEKDLDIQYQAEQNHDPDTDKVKIINPCYSFIEASSNTADIYKMTNGETVSFWQSDGSARSHWIRLKMKPGVVLRRLAIAVASNDHSYMPQLVSVAVGNSRLCLQEIREIRIPSNVTGYVALLENANITQTYVQINIKRCLSDGCDTRIHGLKTMGYQVVKSTEVSISDASAIWYLSLLTSLVTASMESNPALAQTVLQSTQKALQHMPPLSLTPSSTEFPKFFSPNIMEEVDAFLLRIADCCVSPEAELTLLAFALARGSLAKIIMFLSSISDHLDRQYKASSLISSMAAVRLKLLYKNGKPLRLSLQACDVKGKEDKSGPENMLVETSMGDGFLTETGKKKATIILSTADQTSFQVTQIKIRVRKGAIGAKFGLVFAYNEADAFSSEKHFKRFKNYDTWTFKDFRQFLKESSKTTKLTEDEPVGWFELEDDWNDTEIKLQQCRVVQYLMVKFLGTRQESAERLGVQHLSASGYLCPRAERMQLEQLGTAEDGAEGGPTTALCLLNKTLYFIQQLTQDICPASAPRLPPFPSALQDTSHSKSACLLDFSGLSLPLFWEFYRKLMNHGGSEAVKTRVLLLQLLQNCFPVLRTPMERCGTAGSAHVDPEEAVHGLYSHLCEVVDSPEEGAPISQMLRKEALKAILDGAAIFFPDKQSRRDKLFSMMKNISAEDQPESLKLTFESLCKYFSHQDPRGLLLLPLKEAPLDHDVSPVLNVMDTLLLVATRECEALMAVGSGSQSRKVLLSLFWALQGSLLSWVYLQLKAGSTTLCHLARDILLRYVDRFLSGVQDIMTSLLEKYTGAEIMEKLSPSILAMVTRQLIIFLLELSSLDVPHLILLKNFTALVELLKKMYSDKDEDDALSKEPVVLRTWGMESAHSYESSRHETTIFKCPGATSFEVEFDERCETEKRYDYLEFTDARGGKVCYGLKVGTDKWPKKVNFRGGPQLQFLFHSENNNNGWGYKFSVVAYGLPDISVSWVSDLLLLTARLLGRLASRTMALKSPQETGSAKDLPAGKMNHILASALWKPMFRQGLEGEQHTQDGSEVNTRPSDELVKFLVDFASWEPSEDASDSGAEMMKALVLACRKQAARNDVVTGSKVDQAVNAIWACMVYHTPVLHRSLRNYVAQGGKSSFSEDFVHVYSFAEGIRTWMLEMKQRYLVGAVNPSEEKEDDVQEVSTEVLVDACIAKSLLLLKFAPCWAPAADEGPPRNDASHPLLRSTSVSESDFQGSPTSGLQASGSEAGADAPSKGHIPVVQTSGGSDPGSPGSFTGSPHRGSTESLTSLPGETASPFSLHRKVPFSRGRIRLLSFRSLEESRPPLSIKDRFPILKDIMNFLKDQTISDASVLQLLSLKKAQALSVSEVLRTVRRCLCSLGEPHLFQASCILFLQELLAFQKDFTSYFTQLSGSGQEVQDEVRQSYHQLVQMLVDAVQNFESIGDKALLPALSCVQTCLLHLLDMSWEVQDLPLFLNIKLPDLLLSMAQENISVHDIAISQWSEEDEIADYLRNCEWMEECQDGMFEKWYDKIVQGSPEERRKMHMFIARYCDLLNVEISCDGCERIAPWHRYRCLQCTDMDLCKTCFLSGAKPEGHEDDHEMVNMEYACDHCQGLIVGSRINCNVCEDFDLCFGCYNSKRYPDSHLPTHRITVYPMVTIRISDRHRLIQPYIHNYAWLLFCALALYASDLTSERELEGEALVVGALSTAASLQARCSELIADCLLKGQKGRGLRTSALMSLLSSGESASESEPESGQDSLQGGTATVCSPPPPRDKHKGGPIDGQPASHLPLVSGVPTGDKEGQQHDISGLSQTSSDGILTPGEATGAGTDANLDVLPPVTPLDERAAKQPLQEHVFAECSRERILGLLAAMLPPGKPSPGCTLPLQSLSSILPLLFRVVISNAGCLNETYHLTLGLLGQLLLRLSPAAADTAVAEALADRQALLTPGDGAPDPPGWRTTQLLFSLGAVCLDSRIGLDWACLVADILRDLNSSPQWSSVIAVLTDHCMQQLPIQLKRSNLFTLLVLVGFPEVLCMGSHSTFMDNANEQHAVILLKHFTEKNRAAVVDVRTRKRRTVKDYQLVQPPDSQSAPVGPVPLARYLEHFTAICSQLLQNELEGSAPDAVEATWVLSLGLKGLYTSLKRHGVEMGQAAIQQSGLVQLLVRKCSKGTGFSKMWLLRDLEILSIMLYSSKKEISCMAEVTDSEPYDRKPEKEHDSDHSSCCADDPDPNKPDPLEGLDEETKICFQITHDAFNAPLHILRAMYELQMKRTDSFFLEVQKRFDGDVIKTDETICALAQKWQPSKRPRTEERSAKAVDTDMIVVPCVSKPGRCERATEETNLVTQKLITNTEGELQRSYAKQRRTKSSALLRKELDARSNRAVRQFLFKVNEAVAILYARHTLGLLLSEWPAGVPVSEDVLQLSGASHMVYILDMLMQLEEKQLWEKILQNVVKGCSEDMLGSLSLTACQFMEEPGMAVQVRESKHPYDNDTNFEDRVHIPGAIYLCIKFDSRCHTEEGCDELLMASSSDFVQDLHNFSGSPQKWTDFEIPGDTLYYRFISDMSNTEWGYKFTVTGGHRGRFQTGFEILKQILADEQVYSHLPLTDIWEWQVGVACRQTGSQRLKAIHLLLRMLHCPSQRGLELTLLRPLWRLFCTMETGLGQDPTNVTVLLPLHRALTELFFVAEARAMEQGVLQEYLLALTTSEQLLNHTAQALKNVAAISLAINYPNKSTKLLDVSP